ncbi:intron-binding protein aquarius [Histoplasma ohiense]|nr:intron-binding protein aquarius [Histoplasma ohiense (nom. inval.)]
MGLQMRPAMAQSFDIRPTVNDLQEESRWVNLAKTHWMKLSKAPKAKPEVIKNDLWDGLVSEKFAVRSLLILENLHILEKFLWPTYSEDSSNYHVLLIAVIAGVKQREHLPIWEHFTERPTDFSNLFRRILAMNLDTTLPTKSKTYLLSFVISAFRSLEYTLIRKECAPLVTISIWHNLHNDASRNRLLEQSDALKRGWRMAVKRYEKADDSGKAKFRFERSWLYSMLLDFLQRINVADCSDLDNVRYCERFMEFLVDLDSQLPTRRYFNSMLKDLNLLAVIRVSRLYNEESNALFRDFYTLLRHFINFAVDDQSGEHQSPQAVYDAHCGGLAHLQRTAIKHFKDKLTILALSNYGSIEQRNELEAHLSTLTDAELLALCAHIGFRTSYPEQSGIIPDRRLIIEIMVSTFERHRSFQESAEQLAIMPTESNLYDPALIRNESYDGSRPLAIPKLNLQYLSLGDFLWRSFLLYRSESFFEIRKDLELVIKRLQPRLQRNTGTVSFEGFSKMAIPIAKPAIIEVASAKVGSANPAYVRAEIALDVSRLGDNVRREWETLRPDDVVFLLALQPKKSVKQIFSNSRDPKDEVSLLYVRTAEVVHVLDENGRFLREPQTEETNGYRPRPRLRRLLVNLDAASYKTDMENLAKGKSDVYTSINVIIRRRARENNFKPILETMQFLTVANTNLPSWIQEVFLGYGDPASARYTELINKVKSVDFRDTFLNWDHLIQSFPGQTIESAGGAVSHFDPPYVLEMFDDDREATTSNASKKRRRDQIEAVEKAPSSIRVSSYRPPNPGPYPVDAPKLNTIRFTPAQVEAIVSGTQPGLTVIVGPPGTGKTDVATQIISNIYHNFPNERTLLIAHSNQALNQLFQKIMSLDIDQRHLLRLGRGEEELDTEESYSKYGRVDTFLENRGSYLAEVDRLAASIGVEGAHGNSCETAGYFNTVHIRPAWTKYWDKVQAQDCPGETVIAAFPFHLFFSNTPKPLFDPNLSKEELLNIASGCQRHLDKLFSELENIRPFEILRFQRDKANYLLVKEARIIAMTSTHAAMRRQEIAKLGFHYDNIVMEEAAQVTEIESFIPCALQNPRNGELPLKRVVLCGDHLQNSPIVQNMAFRQYANFEQTLFSRLVRLGVPTINLDQQGRSRPSIAELFKWRYPLLGNLPAVETNKEFKLANAGFKFDYQFINVPDYQGFGEREPSAHFIQNLGEAEYTVAIYQYMRLLGYPASKISILTTYAGQRALIKDVLHHRCAKNSLFGLPKIVTTVDKYQGEQNDYVLLSLTRTRTVGYLRDVRRLTVALSRARLGLYILGRREIFESCFELKPAFDILFQRPDKLMLIPGELFPTSRGFVEDATGTPMEGIEHLGQYVYEMTQAKIKALAEEGSAATVATDADEVMATIGEEGEDEDDEDKERFVQPESILD